jgi:nucleotide-binding universal stress UspA family protein
VLLVRLIPTPRAPELRTGLLDEELQVDASVESMRTLVEQAGAAGVTARPLSFLSEDFGGDLARIAGEQKCDAILLGWQRPTLRQELVRLLVRRTFSLAPCDVIVLSDRRGEGIETRPDAPVLVGPSGGSHDEPAIETGIRIAESLRTNLKLAGYLGAGTSAAQERPSEHLALLADDLRQRTKLWVVPDYLAGDTADAFVAESARAAIAVIGTGDDWVRTGGFGTPASELIERVKCALLIVRGAGMMGAPEVEVSPDGRKEWPFITPKRSRDEALPVIALPDRPHLQRLDPYGEAVEAVPIGEELSIGRAPGNRLMLADDPLVSRTHAEIRQDGENHLMEDLGSTNGTLVWRDKQWTEISTAELRDGDLVVIGSNVFRFSHGDSRGGS